GGAARPRRVPRDAPEARAVPRAGVVRRAPRTAAAHAAPARRAPVVQRLVPARLRLRDTAGPSGGGGIRTHEPLWGFRFSRPARSTAPAPRRVPRWYVCYARVSTPPRRRGAPSSQRASGTAIVPPSS